MVEEGRDVEQIKKAIPGARVTVVRLRAPLKTIHDRLRARTQSKKSLDWHLKRAAQLYDQLEKSKVEDMVVDVDEKTPGQIAQEILLVYFF